MSPADHIQSALTAALAHELAGHSVRAASCVLVAAIPVLRGQVSWAGVQAVASSWLAQTTEGVVQSGHGSEEIHSSAREH